MSPLPELLTPRPLLPLKTHTSLLATPWSPVTATATATAIIVIIEQNDDNSSRQADTLKHR